MTLRPIMDRGIGAPAHRMDTFVLIALVLLVVLAAVLVLTMGQRAAMPETALEPVDPVSEGLQERRQAAEQHGTELLERRIELDGRRGSLQGDDDLYMQLERLQERARRGEISDEELEAEKIRLLGG